MRIKPKSQKWLKLRRFLLGVAALALVLLTLFRTRNDSAHLATDEAAGVPDTAATAVPEGAESNGEIAWEYPEGWVDYSDLPDKSLLGDDDQYGLSNWRNLLVNGMDRSNYLTSKYYPQMVEIEHGYAFQERAAEDLKAFLAAARDQGFTVSMQKTYMSYYDQQVRFNGLASTLYDQKKEEGMTLAQAEEEITAQGYYPGADEHQTGLAVNFVDENGNAKFSAPVLEWMTEHCAEYGFILRYPEGREIYDGHKPEPGHYRYVGQLAAEYIMRKGITLEEFVNAYDEDEEIIWLW